MNTCVYEAPTHVPNPFKIFLGGGITGCPDWQVDAIDRLSNLDEVMILNPRREDFPSDDPEAANEQIEWEYEMLRRADLISFWFPCETLCPITLYELGYWTDRDPIKHVVVGVHEEYSRRQDVEIQTALADPDIPVVIGFEHFLSEIEWRIP